MKNSIFFKALAIILCAASLMGMVGGVAGALTLVEGDLYNRTVDQMLDEKLLQTSTSFAEQTALAYASRELGSCPEDMTGHRYDVMPDCDYGYVILDPEGNVLESRNPGLKDSAEVYSLPVKGQYMHLVSTETASQQQAKEAEARASLLGQGVEVMDGQVIPAEGLSINQVWFTDALGNRIYDAYGTHDESHSTYYYPNGYTTESSTYYHEPQGRTGFLFRGTDGQLIYHSFLNENESDFQDTEVYGVMFMSHDSDFYFTTSNPNGLGLLMVENGRLQFASYPAEEPVPEETIPETVPESVPATIPETIAESVPETLPEETAVPTTEVVEETATAEETEETLSEEETTDDSEESTEEESEEETSEEDKEHSSASADPDEEPWFVGDDDIDWEYFDEKAQERIFYDWLFVANLIQEKDLPNDLLPDADLHYWLTEYDYIDSDQTIPKMEPIPEETEPEETEPEETEPEETVPEETAPVETIPAETVAEETVPAETIPEVTEPVLINGKPLESYQVNRTEYMDSTTGEHTTAKYVYLPLPELTVEVYLDRNTLGDAELYNVLEQVRQYRSYLLPVIGICLLLFAASAVYLCTAAGRKPKSEEVRAGGLNRMSLDLYLGLGIFIGAAIIALAGTAAPTLLRRDFTLCCVTVCAAAFAVCLLFVGFCFALVAQCKTPGGFWWRNTLCGIFIRQFMRFGQWLEVFLREKGFPWLSRMCKKLWQAIVAASLWLFHAWEKAGTWLIATFSRFFSWAGRKLNRFFSLIPLTWQWVICGMVLFCMLLIACNTRSEFLTFLCLAGAFAMILYGSYSFGILLESTKRMGKGDLDSKVEDKLLVGSFQEFASDLNDLANVAMVAAQKQLKSERMKTELITNVSHDIKTPLTSIINYVDLLQKPHTQEESEQYLEVLDRQSQRLKKLVEDLMDMSKASTGNMAVEITRVDAVESVNQALGEFADKLERAQLYPVFRHSEDSVPIMADGKLVWRVLSNLLGNAVKYAMPGTRIYLDLVHVNGKVIISLKNISREELNVNAEELMERFVRGDVSRNTEGSGLGLNIAKSLMELQKGSLQLLVDGDLFKVTLIFPDAE